MQADKDATYELEMPAKAQYVGLARLMVGSIARRMRFSEESIDDLKIAVSEMCTNAIVHTGNGKEGRAPVLIRFLVGDGFLTVEVKDSGPGFDPGLVIGRERPGLLDKGFGIPLIRSLVDDFACDSRAEEGTTISITKFVNGEGAEN